jgi:ABC-type antimicrobial peptide transport system permease subunit
MTALLVKSSLPAAETTAAVRRVMTDIDPELSLFGETSVDGMLGLTRLPMRVAGIALGAFGLLAMILSATGLHGLVAYAVARRQREIGIRVAIGATAKNVLTLVLSRVSTLVTIGAAIGVVLALAAAPLLASIVYQASPLDPIVLGGVVVIMVAVGLVSCWGPAKRSLRIDPVLALRAE